jgi:opacity protein-like surface antigen
MLRNLFLFGLFITLFCITPLFSQGIYIGAGIGNTYQNSEFQDIENQAKEISENSTGYKFFAGYRGESIIGLEGGYRNLGTVESNIEDIKFESKTTGWDVMALGRFEIMIVDIFAKAGAFFWKTESVVATESEDQSGTAFAWGLGAGVHFGPIGVRLEWENFEVDKPDNLSMLSLSATYGF